MAYTRSFTDYTPPARYDALPFTSALIRESATEGGVYTTLETIVLSPVDADPSAPASRDFTTALATLATGWYVIRWVDAAASIFDSDPVYYPSSGTALATVADLREALGEQEVDFTDDEISDAISAASELIENACGVSFAPNTVTETLSGTGSTYLLLPGHRPISISSATLDDTALTLSDLTLDVAGVNYDSGWTEGFSNVEITYSHGYAACPAPISRAVIRLARYYLLEDPANNFERATSVSTEDATYSLVTPGVRGAETPIPEVNAVIMAYSERMGAV